MTGIRVSRLGWECWELEKGFKLGRGVSYMKMDSRRKTNPVKEDREKYLNISEIFV